MDDDILTTEDLALILRSVVEQAGPDGLLKDEAIRRAELVADHVRNWKVSAGLYSLFAAGDIRLELTDDETDIRVVQPSQQKEQTRG